MNYKSNCILGTVLVTLCQFIQHRSADQHVALVFDRFKTSLYEIPPNPSADLPCGSWAAACPAQNEGDDKFITNITLTKNALFVHKVCPKEKTVLEAEFHANICDNPFRVSVLYNKINFAFEFGYEIYFRMEDESVFQTTFKVKHYVSAEKIFGAIHKNRKKKLTKLILKELLRLFLKEEKHFWHNENRKLRFIWVSLFKIEFNFIEWTPKRIVYQIRSNNKWPVAWSCEKYDLVTEAYQGINLDHLYSQENQNKIFDNLQLPDKTSPAACTSECLGKWLLIPIDQFHFGSLDYSLCANMATVPIWISTIQESMKKLEKFLYALYRVSGKGLNITSGINGQLQLAKKKKRKLASSKISIYLDAEKQKIPVPEILYKVVKYTPDDECPKNQSCWYSATILIHNDPNFDPKKGKICEDKTSLWGWEDAFKMVETGSEGTPTPSPYIYVCQSDSKLLGKLMGLSALGEPSAMKDLDLKNFPSYNFAKILEEKSVIRNVMYQFVLLGNREHDLRRDQAAAQPSTEESDSRRPVRSPRVPLMESITEADEDAINEDGASDGIIERPPEDFEAGDVVAESMIAEVGEEFRLEETTDEDSNETKPSSKKPAKKRLLHNSPEGEVGQRIISDEDEDNEIPYSESLEKSDHKEESRAEIGSDDDSKSPPKKIRKGSTSFNLEQQSSPGKIQSFREQEMEIENGSNDEGKSPPRGSTDVNIDSNSEEPDTEIGSPKEPKSPPKKQSSPGKSQSFGEQEMEIENDSNDEEKSPPRKSTDVNIGSHSEEPDTEIGSPKESKSPPKNSERASSFDLEEQSSHSKSHSFREEEMEIENDSKNEGKSSPTESADVKMSSHLEEQSSPGKDK